MIHLVSDLPINIPAEYGPLSDKVYTPRHNLTQYSFKDIDLYSLLNLITENNYIVQIDTETEGFDAYTKKILLLQIGNKENQIVIDWRYVTEDIKAILKIFFRRKDLVFLFQNAKFDLRFLYLQSFIPENVADTYLAECVLHLAKDYTIYRKGLDFLTKKYLNIELDKTVRGKIHYHNLSLEVIEYAAEDIMYLEDIYTIQKQLLIENDLLETYRLEAAYVRVLAYMEICGIKLDLEAWNRRIASDKKKYNDLIQQLNEKVLEDTQRFSKFIDRQLDLFRPGLSTTINWQSPSQIISLFKTIEGVDLKTRDKITGMMKDSVDAKVIKPQKDKHPILPTYLEFKNIQKLLSTYGKNWIGHINPTSGRIHTQYNQMMDTGRLSSGGKNKKTKEEYINFLNIPQSNEIRNCIIPKEGNVFVDCDYTGQETVILANYSKEQNMIDLINNKGDMHSFVAKKIYREIEHLSDDEVKENHKSKRQNAKSAGFAIQYGGNDYTISVNLSISREDAKFVYDGYMTAFPTLGKYFSWVQKKTLSNGYILADYVIKRKIYPKELEELKELEKELDENFWNEYRHFKNQGEIPQYYKDTVRKYGKLKGDINRMSLNYPIQSTGASMMKFAGVYIFNKIISTGNFMRVLIPNMIYDQVLLECPENQKEFWTNVVKESMENAANLFCSNPKIKAEPEILTKWKK
jgi:DNA polymerase I